ncbi:Uncharacterized protein F383_19932 [Gossypium arboreum]|uniref:Uncharacterized protein n=1 Tax=Gossypium arboreum TaxID=29729 RepID=A0A0B0MM91_GOSAR|nr:Uncharacterized protein F383_19932 [Gossypium arboreum]
MPGPRHGLTLALIINLMSWQEYPIYFLRFQWEFYYLNDHYTFSNPQSSNSCNIYSMTIQTHIVAI